MARGGNTSVGTLWRPVGLVTLAEPVLFIQLCWLLGLDDPWSSNQVATTLGAAAGMSLLWLLLWHARHRSEPEPAAELVARRTLLVCVERSVIWAAGFFVAWILAPHDSDDPIGLLSVTALTVALSSVLLRLWADHELTRTRPQLRIEPEFLRRRLVWSAVLLGILGILAVAVFDEHLVIMATGIPVTPHVLAAALVTGLVWTLLIRHLTKHPLDKTDSTAFRTLQILPYVTSGSLLLLWILGALLTSLELVLVVGIDRETAGLLFVSALVAAPAVLLTTALWHRRILRPLLENIATRAPSALTHLVSPLTLRTKMLIGFGGLLFFATSAAFLWGYVQYRNLAIRFVQQQAVLQADLLLEKLKSRDTIRGKVSDSEIAGLIRKASRGSDGAFYFLTRTGEFLSFSSKARPPSLPFSARTKIRSEARGTLNIPERSMAGSFTKIVLSDGPRGTLAVLYPDHHGRASGLSRQIKLLTVFFLMIFAVGAIIVYFLVQDVASPIKSLQLRTEEMARGDIHRPVPTGLELDELGRLALTFEHMRHNLDDKLRTIQKLNVELEKKVADRTADLAETNKELTLALEKLTATKDQLVRSEKLASIGQLVAGLAHELNNPTNALINSIKPLEVTVNEIVSKAPTDDEDLAESLADLRVILSVIRHSTSRTRRIVTALGSYSHPDAGPPAPADINAAMEDALSIVSSLLVDVQVEKDYARSLTVLGWRGQLEQVFVNLLANAAQAVEGLDERRIRIETSSTDAMAVVIIEDSGPGIADEHKEKIFDPFFTTKEVGKGTGLGLSICHDIVVRHGGSISVERSSLGGAKFSVAIPLNSEVDQ